MAQATFSLLSKKAQPAAQVGQCSIVIRGIKKIEPSYRSAICSIFSNRISPHAQDQGKILGDPVMQQQQQLQPVLEEIRAELARLQSREIADVGGGPRQKLERLRMR